MGIKLYKRSAGAGKTSWAVELARERSAGLQGSPFVVLPSASQVDDFRLRLGKSGGSLGVNLGTIRDVAEEILARSDQHPVLLTEANQVLLLGRVIAGLDLDFYKLIKGKPGFIRSALRIIWELEAGGITPDAFSSAINQMTHNQRLIEISRIYAAYSEQIAKSNWIDPPGLLLAALTAIQRNPGCCPGWTCVILDGFDDLTPIQANLIARLAENVPELIVTITGSVSESPRPLVHKRFLRLENELALYSSLDFISPDVDLEVDRKTGLIQLEKNLFQPGIAPFAVEKDTILMAAVPDRDAEVREALRWIKSLVMNKTVGYQQTAIITRSLEPYRKLIHRAAEEYGIPVHLLGGMPLSENPLIAGILLLLELADGGKADLNWQSVVELWRSPYFDWQGIEAEVEKDQKPGDPNQDSRDISRIARWGNVIRGYDQWEGAFLGALAESNNIFSSLEDSSQDLPEPHSIQRLWRKFTSFVSLIDPPASGQGLPAYLKWIEGLIGDLNDDEERHPGLDVFSKINGSDEAIAARDFQALVSFMAILNEMAWSAEAFQLEKTDFRSTFSQLKAEVGRRSYQPPFQSDLSVICGDSREVRGLSFKAVALLGIAEGEFPATIKEDPFLRDTDRETLREEGNLPLRQSTESAEAEYFYEAITRSSERLLITRPRMADNGATWQPSPFWEEVLRCIQITPIRTTSRTSPLLKMAGSEAELFQCFAEYPDNIRAKIISGISDHRLETLDQITRAQLVIQSRTGTEFIPGDGFNGGLGDLKHALQNQYPLSHIWSASRLETYQSCPLQFYFSVLLGLEEQEPPQEGLDARQLGNIYHHVLEDLYQSMETGYSVQGLLSELPVIANKVFDEAPYREGFRETAWWEQTRREILANLEKTIIVLEGLDPSFQFYRAEQKFGISGEPYPELTIKIDGQGEYRLRGFIDRVDKNQNGDLRIIDYKTSGTAGFDNASVRHGKKLQLPLYALAAQEGLGLGSVVDGFYFHVRSAQSSYFNLASFYYEGSRGAETAMMCASERGWEAVAAIRDGNFRPIPPENGCPDYCPASGFCWNYQPKQW